MEFKNNSLKKFWVLFLILCISKVCQGQLMCYVCDNCPQINAQTPQFECNEDFFNASGATDSSVQTTTEYSKTTVAKDQTTTEETTITPVTTDNEVTTISSTTTTTNKSTSSDTTKITTISNVTETTTESIKETTTTESTHETTNTTEEQPPTPPTVGSPNSTTGVPTPPNYGTVIPFNAVESLSNQTAAPGQPIKKDEVEVFDFENNTTKPYTPSAEIRSRKSRSVSDVTFHCFKVHATTVNGTMVINRGCSRVQTKESVCEKWETQHPKEKMNKCYPCSRTKCNGSSALNVSITALVVAVVAVFMHRK